MTTPLFTIEDLTRILLAAAGEAEGIAFDSDILDVPFDDLGYDSLALLETGSRIEREHGIELDEETIPESATPRDLLNAVNQQLAAVN